MHWIKVFCLTIVLVFSLCSFKRRIVPEELPGLPYPYELSICAIFQNEAMYLEEWIEHHRKQGVQFFLLFNNNSTDNYKEVLEKYVKKKIVKVVNRSCQSNNIKEWNQIQTQSYSRAISYLKLCSKWCAFIDTDEFLFCPDGTPLPIALKKYEKVGGVVVNWVVYGTSNKYKLAPDEKIVNELVYRSRFDHPVNKHIKSIIQPSQVTFCNNPHFFFYQDGAFAVNENFTRVDGAFSEEHSVQVFRINHYWSKDLDYLIHEKIPRQEKWGRSVQEVFDFAEECNEVYDPILKT